MNLCLINNDFRYELEKLARIFLPYEKIKFYDFAFLSHCCAIARLTEDKAIATLFLNGKVSKKEYNIELEDKKEYELKLALALYDCFVEITGYIPTWGILTGVRPAKLFSKLCKEKGESYTGEYFKNTLKVSDNKISLCKESITGEEAIISLSNPDSFSLYISIPFCPTRCSYCSFVSHSIDKAQKLIPEYVELLCKEIKETALIAKRNKLRLETVYIGGGTPTAISADELEAIMKTVSSNFDLSTLREYTVEAGRPDTITKEKLSVIKENGANRISINPQTMNDSVLNAIGRRHTCKQTIEAFLMARELGFNNINMDLIAGLPTDTYESFNTTLEKVLKLGPESVTVHSLSVKRSSNLSINSDLPEIEAGRIATEMVDSARNELAKNGILPYYMYRQSKTVGNLENVGYSKKGYECLYNVYIMDETHTILACGASGVTKLRQPNGNLIERIFNYKYPYEYINNFDEIILRKNGINVFYDKYKGVVDNGFY